MALSAKARDILEIAMANRQYAKEVADAIDASGNSPAADVAALASYSNMSGVDGTGSNAAPLAASNTNFSAVYAKINAILTSLKNAGIMS